MRRASLEAYAYYNLLDPLLDSLGWKGDEKELHQALPFDCKDFRTDEFVSVMTSLGFILEFENSTLEEGNIKNFPCVFFNSEKSFLIIRKIKNKYLYFDPYEERYFERPLEKASGSFIYFKTKSPLETTLKDKSKNWFQLLLKRFRIPFLVVTLTSFALSLLYLIAPLFVMLIYSQISIANVKTNFGLVAIGIVLYVLALVFFRSIRSYALAGITSRLSFILNQEIFRRLLYLPPHISESGSVGKQLSKLKDFNSIVDFFSGPGFVALFEIPFVFILLAVMYIVGGQIALIPLLAILIFGLIGLYYFPLVRRFSDSNQELSSQKNEYLLETFTKINSIKNYSLQAMWHKKFSEIHTKHLEAGSESHSINSNINIISNGVISIAALFTIGAGVNKVIEGELSSGALLASIMILWKVLNPLRTLFSLSVQLHRLKGSVNQINNFMNLVQEENQKDSFVYYNSIKGKISFQQVSVRYVQNSFPTLLGVNFEILANDVLVVFGHEGSGKTSIVKVLLAMMQPQSGRVLLDDLNLKQINSIKLRSQIAYSPQYASFFDETIIDYFQLSSPETNEEEIYELLEELGIYNEVMKLPEGIETVVDEKDQNMFSFSLLRKLNFVKTIISQANILIFDNLETDLSPEDKHKIFTILNRYKGKKTILITTEETTFFALSDKLLWLDRGKTKVFGPREITEPVILKQLKNFPKMKSSI